MRVEQRLQAIAFVGFGMLMLISAILQAISTYERDQAAVRIAHQAAQIAEQMEDMRVQLDALKAKSDAVKKSMERK